MFRSQHICVTMHLHVSGDVQIPYSVQPWNIKHTSLDVNGPTCWWRFRAQEQPLLRLAVMDPSSPACFGQVVGPWCCLLGGSLLHWHHTRKRYGQPQSAHDCALLLAKASWRGLFSVQFFFSAVASPYPSHLCWHGIALLPWVNAEEGLRAWLAAS